MPTQPHSRERAYHLRSALVAQLTSQGFIKRQSVRQAFESVPRHLFVPDVDVSAAYSNQPIFIRWAVGIPISSSTQPQMMAIMIEQLDLEPGHRVLEIGAGTGYNAAIMARIVGDTGSVVTVDIDRDIVDEAAANLSKMGFHNVTCVRGDGFEGVPTGQPYDRVIVTVGAYDVSPHWVDQLKDGGILVAPLWFRGANLSVALQKREGELTGLFASPCTFIPIRGIWQRTEGYYPIDDPAEDTLQMVIGLESNDPEYLHELNRLSAQDVNLHPIGRSLDGQFYGQDIYCGLFMFLTSHPNVYNVYSSSSETGLLQGPGHALIDLASMSAALLSDRYPDRALVCGKDAAYVQLAELLDRWDASGHPTIDDLRIRALLNAPETVPQGSWHVAKNSAYTWIMSWVSG